MRAHKPDSPGRCRDDSKSLIGLRSWLSEYAQRFAENEIALSVLARSHRIRTLTRSGCHSGIDANAAAIAEHLGPTDSTTARAPQNRSSKTPPSAAKSR